jgi:hypothetical protein
MWTFTVRSPSVLAAQQISFALATGYGEDVIDAHYLHYPRRAKPFTEASLIAALAVR